MWQSIVAAAVVVFATGYAGWTLMPRRLRLGVWSVMGRVPAVRPFAARHLTRERTSGCGACAGSHERKPSSRAS